MLGWAESRYPGRTTPCHNRDWSTMNGFHWSPHLNWTALVPRFPFQYRSNSKSIVPGNSKEFYDLSKGISWSILLKQVYLNGNSISINSIYFSEIMQGVSHVGVGGELMSHRQIRLTWLIAKICLTTTLL